MSFTAVIFGPGSNQGSPLHLFMSFKFPFQPNAPPNTTLCRESGQLSCGMSQFEICLNVSLRCCLLYYSILSLLFSGTNYSGVIFRIPAPKSSPTIKIFSIVSYVKVIFLYQVIYLLKAFRGSSLLTEKA